MKELDILKISVYFKEILNLQLFIFLNNRQYIQMVVSQRMKSQVSCLPKGLFVRLIICFLFKISRLASTFYFSYALISVTLTRIRQSFAYSSQH